MARLESLVNECGCRVWLIIQCAFWRSDEMIDMI